MENSKNLLFPCDCPDGSFGINCPDACYCVQDRDENGNWGPCECGCYFTNSPDFKKIKKSDNVILSANINDNLENIVKFLELFVSYKIGIPESSNKAEPTKLNVNAKPISEVISSLGLNVQR